VNPATFGQLTPSASRLRTQTRPGRIPPQIGDEPKKNSSKTCVSELFSRTEILVRLAGIEPTTPWFVAKYSIQLSYSREALHYSMVQIDRRFACNDFERRGPPRGGGGVARGRPGALSGLAMRARKEKQPRDLRH
jgi:hypothetical protein